MENDNAMLNSVSRLPLLLWLFNGAQQAGLKNASETAGQKVLLVAQLRCHPPSFG